VRGQELVDDFGEQLVGDKGGVGVVADYDAADSFGAAVGVECVVYGEEGLEVFFWGMRCVVPCSSTSCRWPGRVRSATVLLNSVMNSP
jgi:hypothetical protein